MVGQNKENLSFIKKRTKKNVKNQFIYKENSPTILKKRYIDFSSHKKIIGVYDLNDEQLSIRNKNHWNYNFINLISENYR